MAVLANEKEKEIGSQFPNACFCVARRLRIVSAMRKKRVMEIM